MDSRCPGPSPCIELGMASRKIPHISGAKIHHLYSALRIHDGHPHVALYHISPFSCIGVPMKFWRPPGFRVMSTPAMDFDTRKFPRRSFSPDPPGISVHAVLSMRNESRAMWFRPSRFLRCFPVAVFPLDAKIKGSANAPPATNVDPCEKTSPVYGICRILR